MREPENLSDQELEDKLSLAHDRSERLMKEDWNPDLTIEEFRNVMTPIDKLISQLEFEKSMRSPIEWKEIPDYGDKMTIKDWISCCKSGIFIDYDGYGHYASEIQCSNKEVRPSHIKTEQMRNDPEFTHIIWYNR